VKGQIERRGDGAYRLRWYEGRKDGKRVYGSETIRGTKKQAERKLREILARQDRGHAVPSPSRIPTLSQYVETWKGGEAAARLRDRTLRDYLEVLDRHVLPKLGEARLDAIHTARIEIEIVKPLREAGKVRSAQLAVAVLSKVLGAAVKDPTWGLVGNACRGVEVGRKARRELRPLDAEERADFREAIRGTDHEVLWLLMMLTGLGPGEALGLGWDHLDLDAATLRVARTVECKARTIVEDTKRPSRKRVVPLVPELRALLRERWMAAGRPAAGLVFATPAGGPLHLDTLRASHFQPALTAAKVTRKIRIYDLRHGFATAALEAGADVRTVADLMGHSTTRTTQDTYQHPSDERKRAVAEQVAAVIRAGGTQAAPKEA
jgi:integrase